MNWSPPEHGKVEAIELAAVVNECKEENEGDG